MEDHLADTVVRLTLEGYPEHALRLLKIASKVFYHAAPIKYKDQILAQGLKPRGMLGTAGTGKFQNLSNPHMVYLAESAPVAAAILRQSNIRDTALFKVRVTNVRNLYPDENSLSELFERYGDRLPPRVRDKFHFIENKLGYMLQKGLTTFPVKDIKPLWSLQEAFQPYWSEAMDLSDTGGVVAHKGPIRPSDILGYEEDNRWHDVIPGGGNYKTKPTYQMLAVLDHLLDGKPLPKRDYAVDQYLDMFQDIPVEKLRQIREKVRENARKLRSV
jgi:hypothetical protein